MQSTWPKDSYSFPLNGTAKSCDLTAFGLVDFVTLRAAQEYDCVAGAYVVSRKQQE